MPSHYNRQHFLSPVQQRHHKNTLSQGEMLVSAYTSPPQNNPSLTQSRSRCVAVHPHPPTPKRAGVCKHAHVAASIHFCRNGVTKGNCHNLQTLFQTFCTFAPFSFGQSVFTHVRSWTQQSALSSIWPLVQGGKDRLF